MTALDISKQDFSTSLRGYNREEVRAFLDLVAKEFETQQQSESRLSEKVSLLEGKLQEFQNIEQTLRDALVTAQEAAKQSQKGSERERELILKSAKIEADSIRKGAQDEWSRLQNELHQLQAQKKSFVTRLKYILQSQQELMELLESEEPGSKEAVPKTKGGKGEVS